MASIDDLGDLDEIDFNLEDLGWPPAVTGQGGSVSGSAGSWPAGTPIPVGSSGATGQSSVSGGAFTGGSILGAGSINQNVNMKLALITTTLKTDVRYVIVPEDGPCLELEEQKIITPREMIGISKFINMVNCMIATDFALAVKWTELMLNLGISKHFVTGKANMSMYDDDTEVLYLFLFDD